MNEKNKKLSLHSLLIYNLRFKSALFDYISKRPDNYKIFDDLLVNIDDCTSLGIIDGFFETYGKV